MYVYVCAALDGMSIWTERRSSHMPYACQQEVISRQQLPLFLSALPYYMKPTCVLHRNRNGREQAWMFIDQSGRSKWSRVEWGAVEGITGRVTSEKRMGACLENDSFLYCIL